MTITQSHSLDIFLDYLEKHHVIFFRAINKTAKAMPDAFRCIGEPMVEWAHIHLGDDFARILSEGYVHLVVEVNKAQAAYEKRGHYPNRSYAEVYEAAYGNDEFMSKYHWGLYVATFAWIHHLKIFAFFEHMFLTRIEMDEGAKAVPVVADLGSGFGIWSRLVLMTMENWKCVGIDISPTSVNGASQISHSVGLDKRSQYILGDATTYKLNKPADAILSSFLLEHLEQPSSLLDNLAINLKVGGYAWITVALTAAEIDHIAEFRHESEIIKMVEDAGFRVVATLSETPRDMKSQLSFVPRSMAIVAQRRRNDIW